jgi:HK97 gp10 family phage protein
MASKMKLTIEQTGMLPARVVAQIQTNMTNGLKRIAPWLRIYAKAQAPFRTGELRDSIKTEVFEDTGRLVLSAGPLKESHPRFIEYGTMHNKPVPFIRKTMKANKPKIEAVLKEEAKRPVA